MEQSKQLINYWPGSCRWEETQYKHAFGWFPVFHHLWLSKASLLCMFEHWLCWISFMLVDPWCRGTWFTCSLKTKVFFIDNNIVWIHDAVVLGSQPIWKVKLLFLVCICNTWFTTNLKSTVALSCGSFAASKRFPTMHNLGIHKEGLSNTESVSTLTRAQYAQSTRAHYALCTLHRGPPYTALCTRAQYALMQNPQGPTMHYALICSTMHKGPGQGYRHRKPQGSDHHA